MATGAWRAVATRGGGDRRLSKGRSIGRHYKGRQRRLRRRMALRLASVAGVPGAVGSKATRVSGGVCAAAYAKRDSR